MNYVRTECSVPPNKPMNPTPVRGSLVAALLSAGYRQARWAVSSALATALLEPLEAPADGERCRRPVGSLPRLGILAGGEFDEEAAVELIGACSRGGVERTSGRICGSVAQSHLSAPETQREHEVRPWSDAPFAVGLN